MPERVLWALTLVGGAAGMLVGMGVFRHKTRHAAFAWGVPAALLVQLAALAYLAMRM